MRRPKINCIKDIEHYRKLRIAIENVKLTQFYYKSVENCDEEHIISHDYFNLDSRFFSGNISHIVHRLAVVRGCECLCPYL